MEEYALGLAVLPSIAAFIVGLTTLNRLRDQHVPWGDAFLKAFTRALLAFAIGVVGCAALLLIAIALVFWTR